MKQFIKSFFYSEGKPAPPYFWITVFCGLTVTMIIMRLFQFNFSDALILGNLGFIVAWVSVYSWQKSKKENGNGKDNSPSAPGV